MDTWWNKPRDGVETIELPTTSSSLTCALVSESLPRLFQVEYPGLVENPTNAVRTLGGIHKVSQTFSVPRKKLELRFRPSDVYCKAAYGEPNVTCGLLIKLRRKKATAKEVSKSPEPSILIELSHLPDSSQDDTDRRDAGNSASASLLSDASTSNTQYRIVESGKQQIIVFDGPLPASLRQNMEQQLKNQQSKKESEEEEPPNPGHFEAGIQILEEEQLFLEKLTQRKRFQRCIDDESLFSKDVRAAFNRNRIYLKVPHHLSDIRAKRSGTDLEVLGVISRNYKFNGMCDFQYLPMKKTKKQRHISIINKIVPAFGNPDVQNSTLDDLIVCRLGKEGHDKNIPSFLVPSVLSRVDKPVDDLVSFLDGGLAKDIVYNHQPHTLSTTRAKRVIYSHLCNFRVTDNNINSSECLVPSEPMQQAMNDAAKRGLMGSHFDHVKRLFEKRPIYTKIQIEHECGVGIFSLKYLLPLVAYFALNGPWRSCWIRYGYDPRKDRFAYSYQLLDYRVPNPYRALMERKRNITVEVEQECLYVYHPDTIPPKCQMIYQLCEIRIKEVDNLIRALQAKMVENVNQKFDTRYGFLTEDIVEYCRYCISRNIELCLFNQGRIPSVTLPEVALPSLDIDSSDTSLRQGISRIAQTHGRRAGEKRKMKPRTRPNPYLESDEVSNQSSNVADLKIRDRYPSEKSSGSSESEDEDEQRILQEALDATSLGAMDPEFTDDEEDVNPEEINPDQILGLE